MSSPNELPSQTEFGQFRAYLALKGFSQAWINQHTDNSKTRSEIADDLKAAMKELPKA